VLRVFLIAQYWVTDTPQDKRALGRAAAPALDFETRTQMITPAGHRDYVANTSRHALWQRWLVSWGGSLAQASGDGRFQMPRAPGAAAPLALFLAPKSFGLSGYWGLNRDEPARIGAETSSRSRLSQLPFPY